jgi:hypothetical protein
MSGRPQRGPKAATKTLRVRLTDAEWAALEKRAKSHGMSISEYVRARTFGSVTRES